MRFIDTIQYPSANGQTTTISGLNSHARCSSRCITLTIARVSPHPQHSCPVRFRNIQTGIPGPSIHSTGSRIIATGINKSSAKCNLGDRMKFRNMALGCVGCKLALRRRPCIAEPCIAERPPCSRGRPFRKRIVYSLTIRPCSSVNLPVTIIIRSMSVHTPQPPAVNSCIRPVPVLPT